MGEHKGLKKVASYMGIMKNWARLHFKDASHVIVSSHVTKECMTSHYYTKVRARLFYAMREIDIFLALRDNGFLMKLTLL